MTQNKNVYQWSKRDKFLYIKWFEEIDQQDINLVGGKGANLGEMTDAGFSIPKGFCITTFAYKEFVKDSGLHEAIFKQVENINVSDVTDLQKKGNKIRQLIVDADIPRYIKEEILSAHQSLHADLDEEIYVAVRSSATAEDLPEASFAGQHDTYLNISGEEDLLLHIKKCWASLWSDRAISYREKNNIEHSKVYMSVVVQRMIESEAAGVMFTANPATGNQDEIVIEASFGLGEAVVSGKVAPDSYVVDKKSFEIKKKTISEKMLKVVRNIEDEQGTVEVSIPKEDRNKSVLLDEQIKELARIGLDVETHYGKPQDIEWNRHQNLFYLLQSRPITALATRDERQEYLYREIDRLKKIASGKEIVWSNMFFAELLPAPTPLTFEFAEKMFAGVDSAYRELGFGGLYGEKLPIELICGRLYFNVNEFVELPIFPGLPVVNRFLERIKEDLSQASLDTMFGLKKLGFLDLLKLPVYICRAIPLMIRFKKAIRKHDRRYRDEILPAYLSFLEEIRKRDWNTLSEDELLSNLKRLLDHVTKEPRKWWELGNILSLFTYGQLEWVVRKWYGDASVTPELVGGMEGNKTLETNMEMWKLSQEVRNLAPVFLSHEPDEIHSLLSETDDGQEFLEKVQSFLSEYGHRVCGELELANARWRENPSFVYRMIQSYLKTGSANPVEQFEEQKKRRAEVSRKIHQKFRSGILNKLFPIKKMVFRDVLRLAQTYAPYRETPKFYFLIELAEIRRIALELGARFMERKTLEELNDIFFLFLTEIKDIVREKISSVEVKKLVVTRRSEREIGLSIDIPSVIFSSELNELGKPKEAEFSQVLTGLPVSSGRVTGNARIIMDPVESSELRSGEIMVAPYTDPSWTALFLMIKGLVLDVGTVLSHGSIIAREYGLPAIVNVKGATKVIKNGQKITVDGDEGKVYLLKSI